MKKAVITGGNKGIGLSCLEMLLEKGFEVIVIARNFKDFPYKDNENVSCIEYDISDVAGIKNLCEKIECVDVLINNAGVMYSLPYNDYPLDKQMQLMSVNLYAPIEFIKCCSEKMLQNGGGRIINVTSVAGQIGHPDVWYGASKAGLINATKSFAKILAQDSITVNAVAPGPTLTDMMQVIPEDRKAMMKSNTYTKRFAEASEVAKTIVWLATEAPEYINGVCIDINNGSFPR